MRRANTIAVSIALAVLAAPSAASAMALVGNDRGDALLFFKAREYYARPTEVSARTGAGQFGQPALLPALGATFSQAAMGSGGDAVAVGHSGSDALLFSFRPAGGEFGPRVTLSQKVRVGRPRVAVNARGDAVAIWGPELAGLRGGIRMAFRPAAGEFTPSFAFEPAGDRIVYGGYDVGLADDGTATVVWRAFDGKSKVMAATRAPDETFGPAQTLSAPEEDTQYFDLAVNGPGGALVTWASPAGLLISERPPGGAFGAPFAATEPGEGTAYARTLRLKDDGAAMITWVSGKPYRLRAAIRRSGGEFERITIENEGAGGSYGDAAAALGPHGDAAFVWNNGRAIQGAYRSADGRVGGPFDLFEAAPFVDVIRATGLVLDETGRATTGWEESNGERALERLRSFGADGAAPAITLARRSSWIREAPPSACSPKNTRTLVKTKRVRVYEVVRGWNRGYAYGCLYARGVPIELGVGDGVYDGPAVSIAGPLVGSAFESCDIETCATIVDVTDLRDQYSTRNGGLIVQESTSDTVKVGSLRLRRDGALGFITCPEDGSFPNEREPTCLHPGSRDRVWVAGAYTRAKKVVDSGRGIDPASLRLNGSVLSWLKDGRRRTYRLP
jgi:hypothetical protein